MPSSQQPTIKASHSQVSFGYMLNSALRATVFHPQRWMMRMICLFFRKRPCCFGFSQMDLRLFGLLSNRKMIRPQLWVPFCSMHCVELPRPFLWTVGEILVIVPFMRVPRHSIVDKWKCHISWRSNIAEIHIVIHFSNLFIHFICSFIYLF